jgi:hypothetical protein
MRARRHGTRIKLSPQLALAAVGAMLLFWLLAYPSEFRRSPWLELRGLVGFASTYEASYADCSDPRRDMPRSDLTGWALGFAGHWAFRFRADSDADAVAFARGARPDCMLFALSRKRRHYFDGGVSIRPRDRIDLGAYP